MTEPIAPVLITTVAEPVPSRTKPATFSTEMDTLLGKFPAVFSEMNATATNVSTNATVASEKAVIATAQAVIATASATIATGAANYEGLWSNLTGVYSKGVSVGHLGSFWVLNVDLADITTSEPSDVNTDWLKATFSLFSNVTALEQAHAIALYF